ncbi:MAG: DEAD/DEAH box helicase family protein [Halanaerobiales bacterium]|nr:DEAD/DEAH box helicase family protein [Halanaerobiales bacterium]
MKWNFDLSYSSYSTYKESQLIFYFNKIAKLPIDTKVPEVYGNVGNICHTIAEKYIENKNINLLNEFNILWDKYKINSKRGLNGKILPKPLWLNQILIIKKYIDFNFKNKNIITEKYLEYLGDEFNGLKIKGYVDIFIKNNNKIILYDWKTNSSHNYNTHKLQRKFYSWLCYKIYNIIPECIWYYTRKTKEEKDIFTKKELDDFTKELIEFKNNIINKGKNIDNYDTGKFDGIFNSHYKKCREENQRRLNINNIMCTIKNNTIYIHTKLSKELLNTLDNEYSYNIEGAIWSNLYKRGIWDGKKHLFIRGKQTLPLGLFFSLLDLLKKYNAYYKTELKIKVIDDRNKEIMFKKFNKVYKKSLLNLHYYQKDAINIAIKKEMGIIYIGTGGGKTEIAKEIIRRVDGRSLFVVNRIELANQTVDEFKKDLTNNVGVLIEGNLDIYNKVTIASIQTIAAILKRKDETTEKLKIFLSNINVCFWDECQNIKSTGMYGVFSTNLINCRYLFGLTGTPFRADENTLMMNGVVGFSIYIKTTEELQDENFICKSRCLFIDNKKTKQDVYEKFTEKYNEFIVKNEDRNSYIKDIVDKNPDKKILIVTKIIKHGEMLSKMCDGYLITGTTNRNLRKDYFDEFKNSGKNVLVGSVKIFSSGINIPNLDIIINACANKSDVDTIQTIGRVLRKNTNKTEGLYIDFYDNDTYFKKFSDERIKILEKYGHKIERFK